jgi:iron complex transport system ATP-binding protein
MLQVQKVSYRIGQATLVRDVSLEVKTGEMLAIVGANGAGKTTLLRLMAGDITPSAGTVVLKGKPLAKYGSRELALKRAVMPQQTSITFDFSAHDVVMMGRHPHIRWGETREDHRVVEVALERTATTHLKEQPFATLSGGERARVTLARVLAQQTEMLLLDEPTSALDLRHQHMTLQIARDLAHDKHAVIAVLHDLNLAAMYADRVGMMMDGHLVALGKPEEVLTADNIQMAFSLPVEVMPHPHQDCPLIVTLAPGNGYEAPIARLPAAQQQALAVAINEPE